MSGFVSFVSSGPGDPELLTVRAVERLKSADVILFDDLASGPILAHARAGATRTLRPSQGSPHQFQQLAARAWEGYQ